VWVLGCRPQPTLAKANPPLQRAHQQQQTQMLVGPPGHRGTHMYIGQNMVLQGIKKVNKRYPKVWVGYHITLFNCFVTTIRCSGVLARHEGLFSQATCKGERAETHLRVSRLAELCCGTDGSHLWVCSHRNRLLSLHREQGLRAR